MTSGLNEIPSRGQIDHLLAMMALLAEGVSAPSSAATDLLERIRNLSEPGRNLPDALVLAEWRQELSGVIREVNSARELGHQKAPDDVPEAPADQVSRISATSAAEAEIEKAARMQRPPLLAVLFVDQLRALNARFGQDVGERVLALAAPELARLVSDFGAVFRWNGPAFLLVSAFDRSGRTKLERKLEDLSSNRIELTVDLDDRSIHLKVNVSWHVQPIASGEPSAAIVRALNDIVALRARK